MNSIPASAALPVAMAGYGSIWLIALIILSARRPGAWTFPATVLVIFVILTLVAYLTTRRSPIPGVRFRRSRAQASSTAAYLVFFGIAIVGWMFSWIRTLESAQQQALVMMLVKLITMAGIPLLLLVAFGAPLRSFLVARWLPRRWVPLAVVLSASMLAVMALATPALAQLEALALSPGVIACALVLNALWVLLEAALCEEILFRVFLQTQLEAWMARSTAIVLGALVFGLAHVPGLWLRGDPSMNALVASETSTLLWSTAYAIAVLSPPALLFGALWSRTRSLGLIVVVHTSINVLPTLPGFIALWMDR